MKKILSLYPNNEKISRTRTNYKNKYPTTMKGKNKIAECLSDPNRN